METVQGSERHHVIVAIPAVSQGRVAFARALDRLQDDVADDHAMRRHGTVTHDAL
jgi:hypothetical protein